LSDFFLVGTGRGRDLTLEKERYPKDGRKKKATGPERARELRVDTHHREG